MHANNNANIKESVACMYENNEAKTGNTTIKPVIIMQLIVLFILNSDIMRIDIKTRYKITSVPIIIGILYPPLNL